MRTLEMGVLSLILAVALVLPATAQDLQQGLIAYWSFDGDATDSSGNGYDGAENGDVAYATGRFGDALNLESDGAYLEMANSEDLKLMGSFTISAHVHLSDTDHGDILYHGLGCSHGRVGSSESKAQNLMRRWSPIALSSAFALETVGHT